VGGKGFYRRLIRGILDEAGVRYIDGLPDNVEITVRENEDRHVRFIFNNSGEDRSFVLDGKEVTLRPFEMKTEIIPAQ
jgi:hypothetical protein